ncbi:MAG: prepilin-type N-terminal cleavage/methylation domain-containing protein [Verrucomicrobiaceae bacterium]|nr:prepilin-type N-terminal cleavage/methylation domain-containing protein [Verrucomicrobiaceae bacterium]
MNIHITRRSALRRVAFSLVEMLAAVAIIGVISFMAIPSITRMRGDSERNVAITRAEALNLAQVSFMQVKGRSDAQLLWQQAGNNVQARYNLLKPYIAFAEDNLLNGYFPSGYQVQFNSNITSLSKTVLIGPSGRIYY